VLLVIAFHAGVPLPGGFLGVDVFFAISGFVITRMLLHELETTGRLDLPRFYARRVKRLLPAMALMVTVVAALGTLASTAAGQRDAGFTGAAASMFGANIRLALQATGYFDVRATLDPFLHTWSLGVEEQFYFFPVLLVAGGSSPRGVQSSRARCSRSAPARSHSPSLSPAGCSSPTPVWPAGWRSTGRRCGPGSSRPERSSRSPLPGPRSSRPAPCGS
jgi:peptidoglycan/LPS O-acetylase OafA/YrhL